MARRITIPDALRDVILECCRYGKSSPEALLEDFQEQASKTLQQDRFFARQFLEFSVYQCLHSIGPSAMKELLKEARFRKATYLFMQSWDATVLTRKSQENLNLKEAAVSPTEVSEAAFLRIAPAVAGSTNPVTAHALYDALCKSSFGLSLDKWDKYLQAVSRSEVERAKQTAAAAKTLGLQPGEVVLAEAGVSLAQWANGESGHGHLTLTDRALYFEGDSKRFLGPRQPSQRLDLSLDLSQDVHSQRTGPMGSKIFDRALTVTSDEWPNPWELDFMEYSGHRQRDTWQAMIGEILAVHDFVREYRPPLPAARAEGEEEGEGEGWDSEGEAEAEAERQAVDAECRNAVLMALEGISHLQAVSSLQGGSLPLHSGRLLPFLWCASIPEGHLVEQALAVEIWGQRQKKNQEGGEGEGLGAGELSGNSLLGSLSTSLLQSFVGPAKGQEEGEEEEEEEEKEEGRGEAGKGRGLRSGLKRLRAQRKERVQALLARGPHELSAGRLPAVGASGAVYGKQWMSSASWQSEESLVFWREGARLAEEGLWAGGPLLVGGKTKLEEAVEQGRAQEGLAEKAQTSINGALIDGIPKNVDLLKELLYPVIIVSRFVLVRAPSWESPPLTLGTALLLLYLVNSKYLWMLPSVCVLCVVTMAIILRFRRRTSATLPVVFLTKRPASAVKKIIRLKEVLDTIAAVLQAVNIFLLKCRTILHSDVPKATDKVLLAAGAISVALLILVWIPYRFYISALILHVFSSKLIAKKQKGSRQTLGRRLKSWWNTIPVAPVNMVILEQEEWDAEVKGIPTEAIDKDTIIHKLGKEDQLENINTIASTTTLNGEDEDEKPPFLDRDMSRSMRVVARFIAD